MVSAAIAAILSGGIWAGVRTPAVSGGETRTLSLYQVHTKESLTVTYMVDGRYIPSALKKINYLMRDWRRQEVIKIDPKTIDLMWELHADLGSQRPVNIISGYRSPKTNAFLKRVGRNVARKSQHMIGKAIDMYFSDVPTEKIRNSALVRQVGGVGYYRSSGGPTGFLHIDSGKVRQWGPAISSSQMAKINRDYRKTIGARLSRKDRTLVAAAVVQPPAGTTLYDADDEELAELNADARSETAAPRAKPAGKPPKDLVKGYPVPKPRPKPIEVLMMAAMTMKIEPASAPPPTEVKATHASPVSDSIGAVEAASAMLEESGPVSNAAAKGSFAEQVRDGTAEELPMIKTITASAGGDDLFWWPSQVIFNGDKAVRRDGAPQPFDSLLQGILPGSAEAAEPDGSPATPKLTMATVMQTAEGKGDMLVVNRDGKGSLGQPPARPHARRRLVVPSETN